MARYRMEDDTIVDTKNAKCSFDESTYWNGSNHISKATGDQWLHEEMFVSRKGRYYIVHMSQWQGSVDHAEWVSPEAATRWLLRNDYAHEDIPDELQKFIEVVTE